MQLTNICNCYISWPPRQHTWALIVGKYSNTCLTEDAYVGTTGMPIISIMNFIKSPKKWSGQNQTSRPAPTRMSFRSPCSQLGLPTFQFFTFLYKQAWEHLSRKWHQCLQRRKGPPTERMLSSVVCTTLLATLQLIVQYGSLMRIWPDSPLLCESGLCYWCCLTLSPALSIVALYPGQHEVHRCGDHYIVSKERSRCESWLQFQEECM